MAAIAEYKKKEEVYMARAAELDEMTKARDEQRKYHDDLRLSFLKIHKYTLRNCHCHEISSDDSFVKIYFRYSS